MNLGEALLPILPCAKGVVAFVGAGGKSTALYRFARERSEAQGPVLITTTTHLADPRLEPVPPIAELVFHPDLEGAGAPATLPGPRPGVTILLSRPVEPGKVKGIHPDWIPPLKAAWDLILVEADGSRRLPVKAPAPFEPVLPPGTDLVAGVIGLDCLGRGMDGATVHRPECFHAVTGCPPGAPIGWEHLAALVRHPQGLFKGATGLRAVLLNKADAAAFLPSPAQMAGLDADLVLLCSLEAANGVIVCHRGDRQ
jgi:probable selenium-dependent hydroxylase accessory protein YqeC